MQTVLAMIGGAVLMAICFGGYVVFTKTSRMFKELVAGMKGMKALAESSSSVALELKLLRSIMEASVHPPAEAEEPEAVARRSARPHMPFPNPYQNMYPQVDVPDAGPDEVEIFETTDAQAAEIENIEEVRNQGFEADPGELHEP